MNIKKVLLLVGGLLLGSLLGLLIIISDSNFSRNLINKTSPVIGQELSSFRAKDVAGNYFELQDLNSKPLVINFWATWCKPCETEMPLLNQLFRHRSDELTIIGINSEETLAEVLDYQKKLGINFLLLLDEDGKISDQFQITGLPTTFFVDKNGILQAMHIGLLDEMLLDGYLAKIGVAP